MVPAQLGIDLDDMTNPYQAAGASAIAFCIGAGVPLLAAAFIESAQWRIVSVVGTLAVSSVVRQHAHHALAKEAQSCSGFEKGWSALPCAALLASPSAPLFPFQSSCSELVGCCAAECCAPRTLGLSIF